MDYLLRQEIFENNKMFPSKNMGDYVGEATKFFPTIRLDGEISNTYNSPFQTPITNRYSSSNDSTSPESYFTSPFQLNPPFEHNIPRSDTPKTYVSHLSNYYNESSNRNIPKGFSQNDDNPNDWSFNLYDTQYDRQIGTPTRQPRAIVGRKVFDRDSKLTGDRRSKLDIDTSNIGQPAIPLYHLFPSNDRSFDILVPVRKSVDSVNYAHISPTSTTALSYTSQNPSPPSRTKIYYDNPSPNTLYKETLLASTSLQNLSPLSNNKSMYYDNLSPNVLYSDSLLSSTLSQPQSPPSSYYGNLSQNLHTESMLASTPKRLQYTEKLSPPTNRLKYTEYQSHSSPNKRRPENYTPVSLNPSTPEFKPRHKLPSSMSSQNDLDLSKICTFCKKNGETSQVYLNHKVKERVGNQYKVTCPILRALICSVCGASGDNAHTITYCPVMKSTNNGQPLQSTTVTLKSTRTKSNGTKRY